MSYKTNATNGEEKDEMHADTFVFDFASFSNCFRNYLFLPTHATVSKI